MSNLNKHICCKTIQIGDRTADLYWPSGPVQAGILFLHGGGFVEGSRTQFAAICRRLCSCRQVTCLSLDYRLAPDAAFPAPIQDTVAAFRWMIQHLHLPADRIFVAGGSPGGCIAALSVLAGPRRQAHWHIGPGPMPRRAILLNGICNLSAFYQLNPQEQPRVLAFLGGDPTRMAQADPMLCPAPGRSFLLLHGTADTIVPPVLCRTFAARLRRAGSKAETIWFYDKPHAWFNTPEQAIPVADCIGRYIKRTLKE